MRFQYSHEVTNLLFKLVGLINLRMRNMSIGKDKDFEGVYYISDTFHNMQRLVITNEEELKPYFENIENEINYLKEKRNTTITNNNYFIEKYIELLEIMKKEVNDFIKLKNIEDF